MSTNIERLLYYEGEYLRSFDMEAEQAYHMEMRRRLNLALHLHGIVHGLDVVESEVVKGALPQFNVTPGMAIDAYGREIVVASHYLLTEDVLRDNKINCGGTYAVWLEYAREPARPPAAGYRLCDVEKQYTRWRESFRITLGADCDPPNDPEPAFEDPLPDDPEKAPWRLRLGYVDVDRKTGKLLVSAVRAEDRTYVGLRAQRIVAPVKGLLAGKDEVPISVEADLWANKNVVVAEKDFKVDPEHVLPEPEDKDNFPPAAGNVKAENLFVRQGLYASKGEKWLELAEYVKQMVPEIQVGVKTITPTASTSNPSNDVYVLSLRSAMARPNGATMSVSLSGIEWASLSDFKKWLASNPDQSTRLAVGVSVDTKNINKHKDSDNVYDFPVSWGVAPPSVPGPSEQPMLNVKSITFSYIAVFYP